MHLFYIFVFTRWKYLNLLATTAFLKNIFFLIALSNVKIRLLHLDAKLLSGTILDFFFTRLHHVVFKTHQIIQKPDADDASAALLPVKKPTDFVPELPVLRPPTSKNSHPPIHPSEDSNSDSTQVGNWATGQSIYPPLVTVPASVAQ